MKPKAANPDSISDRIATETKTLHDQNNKLANLKLILAIRSATIFREYILAFYHLYATFEHETAKIRTGKDARLSRIFTAIHEPLLDRTQAIKADLEFYYDQIQITDPTIRPPTPLQQEYVAHIQYIAKTDPIRLLSFSSVMVLALFAGGRIIHSRMIRRTGFYPQKEGLEHSEIVERGTHIFRIESDDVEALRVRYRRNYDRVVLEELDEREQTVLVDEAKEIFVRNAGLIDEVKVPGSVGLILETFQVAIASFLVVLVFLVCLWSILR